MEITTSDLQRLGFTQGVLPGLLDQFYALPIPSLTSDLHYLAVEPDVMAIHIIAHEPKVPDLQVLCIAYRDLAYLTRLVEALNG